MSAPLDPFIEREIFSDDPIDEDTVDEWDEDRIDNIGQNGNDGDHYDESKN